MGCNFENCVVYENFDETENKELPFLVAVKDRAITTEERWVLTVLSKKEGKELYEYLKKFYEEESN
mgnify:CR=1 FL=1